MKMLKEFTRSQPNFGLRTAGLDYGIWITPDLTNGTKPHTGLTENRNRCYKCPEQIPGREAASFPYQQITTYLYTCLPHTKKNLERNVIVLIFMNANELIWASCRAKGPLLLICVAIPNMAPFIQRTFIAILYAVHKEHHLTATKPKFLILIPEHNTWQN
jgi:hypothetical protein